MVVSSLLMMQARAVMLCSSLNASRVQEVQVAGAGCRGSSMYGVVQFSAAERPARCCA